MAIVAAALLWQGRGRAPRPSIWFDGAVLRPEELIAHGAELARFHRTTYNSSSFGLVLGRLRSNFRLITQVYSQAAADLRRDKAIAPAGEWLLDNYYLVEEQVKEILITVRSRRFRRLPVLTNGQYRGLPRIYAIALELVAHSDGRVDEQALIGFIESYQQEKRLTIAEIWALSLMLRIALVEKVRACCALLAETHGHWRQAEELVARPQQLLERLEAMSGLAPALVEHLLDISRQGKLDRQQIREVLAKRLAERDLTLEQVVQAEHQAEAGRATALGNAFTSLKNTASLDWNEIFEALCPVDKVLGQDPVYLAMDFPSRNYYRSRVQSLARRARVSETRVAKLAMECARDGQGVQGHCGYYLVDEGREQLAARLGRSFAELQLSGGAYIAGAAVLTLVLALAALALGPGFSPAALLLILLPASGVAVALLNTLLLRLRKPAFLPKLEYREGIPPEAATMVVVPALLTSAAGARELVRRLEVHYLANPLDNLYFCLLGDFKDAESQVLEADEEILAAARQGVQELNARYGQGRFFVLMRKRSFSKTQQKWLGWERKRGALMELNALLSGVGVTTFIQPPPLPQVKYILTLDADTRLPLAAARKLVGTISHPLNRVKVEGGRVLRGYGLIQPRMGVSIESTNRSLFARVLAGPGGVDTYTTATSDIYQDWFGQGIFTGKGIYDRAAAVKLLADIPENSILSHDLLEGALLRTGLATDIELVDDFPAKYSSYVQRQHRWTRGDWQLLPWLRRKSGLSLLSRWQIFDNLRRSLLPLSLMVLAAAGLTVLPGGALFWTLVVLAALLLPHCFSLLDFNWIGYFGNLSAGGQATGLRLFAWQLLLHLAFLPHQAWVNGDAVLRSLYRVYISRRNLLEWTTAAEAERKGGEDYWRRFAPVLLALLGLAALVAALNVSALAVYAPLLVLWLLAPALAGRVSRPGEGSPRPGGEAVKALRSLARKTWYYYQDLVGPSTSHLPPDNYQVDPPNGVDPRTSPTNIGFYLLSVLAARDLGYIPTTEMVRRLESTLTSVEALHKWKGHLFNWYHTGDLEVLRPYFVSTVDSGNFVCMLVALAQGLREYLDRPLVEVCLMQGVLDTLEADLFTAPEAVTINQWADLVADLETEEQGPRLCQLLAWLREELDSLFPHTEILTHPPVFLKQEQFAPLAELVRRIREHPSPRVLAAAYPEMLAAIDACLEGAAAQEEDYLLVLKDDILRLAPAARQLVEKLEDLILRLEALAAQTDFSALYNPRRHLFSIGYSVDEETLVDTHYDLLASEARMTSYWAVVQGQVPVKHWYKPGRAMTRIDGSRALVSWAGTMFEYLMPPLLLRNYPNTLLAETVQAVVAAQRRYAARRSLPWGVSESGYYAFDYRLNYQYRAFGIPDLGLKRGLVQDMVVSSYSTLLALPFAPREALANLARLRELGLEGEYGLYEAVDFTPQRVGSGLGLVKSYMAHHQGMGFIALANYLLDFAMVRRFHADPRVEAGELLLQERIPLQPVLTKQIREPVLPLQKRREGLEEVERSFGIPRGVPPNCHLLSNGSYTVFLTDSGSGFSRRGDIQVSRWRDLAPGRPYGTFIFVKSLNNDRVWSTTLAPLDAEPDFYRVNFSQDKASYFREARNIDTRTDIIVSSEDNAEIRQVVVTNHGTKAASLELTSYLEVVLSSQAADLAHPAFNKLFVETELLARDNALLASRRPRRPGEERLYALHQVVVEGESVGSLQFETDRAKFLGRGRDISQPVALHQPLSNSLGPVLDPVFSLRRQIRLGPGETGTVTFITAQGTRKEMEEVAEKYRDPGTIRRAFDLAYARSQVEYRFLKLPPQLLEASQQALGHLFFPSPTRRRYQEILAKNQLTQRGLWAQGISGDNPIVLVNVADTEEIEIVAEAVRAHEYWRFKGLNIDLVILNSEGGGYLEPVRDLIRDVVQLSQTPELDRPGGIFIRSAGQMSRAEQILLFAAARLILRGGEPLARQLERALPSWPEPLPTLPEPDYPSQPVQLPGELQFFNGYGGFGADGSEYHILLRERMTPAPWVNILANPQFGCIASERGAGFTFAENSRENKLTPWSNDPVSDPPGEVIYLRDEESGALWTVTAAPIREEEPYLITHGWGYTKYAHCSHGIDQQLTVFVPLEDSVKLSLLRLQNLGEEERRLTVTYYIRPVLGVSDEVCQQHLITAWEEDVLTVRNPYNGDFPGRVVWLSASAPVLGYTGDRTEFLGPGGRLARPEALTRTGLSGTVGAGLDPCAALQVTVTLGPGEERELLFQLGQAQSMEAAKGAAKKYTPEEARAALGQVREHWRELAGSIAAETPEPALNILLGWLVYQSLACRLWARTGFYQCGGAYGYRDQLQDAMNLVALVPHLTREQILLHAAHQFREGDVQHWWHPGTNNRGVRTRFSDDLLWLPLAVARYIQVTGDQEILDTEIPFLEGRLLEEGEDEHYGEAQVSEERASLYEHCCRAIKRALKFGSHGIPLMGSGDWNDGMSSVGNGGRGESIWLGWFLYTILQDFAPLCRARGDEALAEHYLKQAEGILTALEAKCWDGRWYRRAYFDDGTPLGSAENSECTIDSIAQSWAVITGAARRDRMEEAMNEVNARLVRENEGLILLFTPPFADGPLQPGYIKGYLPGVRENGGQYTHASCWVIMAMALLGRGDEALNLLQLINPINHSRTPIECATYKTEPYSLAADVYSAHPHAGRGGWTWYTGAAAWLHRVAVENVLGIRRRGSRLVVEPCIPRTWREFQVSFRYGSSRYDINVHNPREINQGVAEIRVDGQVVGEIELADDGQVHRVEVIMGR